MPKSAAATASSQTVRHVVVTGASRGLGRAMVEGLIEQGCQVLGCARNEQAMAELSRRYGPPHGFAAVDVADDTQVRKWAQHVLERMPQIDLLLNNAAVINANAPLWEVSAADFDRVLQVNVQGVANVIRHLAPAMVARRRGVIVNFSSGWGRSTSPEVAPYCASKYAIEGLTKALAQELPDGMAAVPLNPGVIDTDMLRSCFGADARSYPDPQQWATRAVPFLLQLGERHNGQSLSVPG